MSAAEVVADDAACDACGAPLGAGDLFCEACGHQLAAPASEPTAGGAGPACPGCGTPDPFDDDGWCGVCGRKQPAPRDHLEIVATDGFAGVTDRGIRHHRNEDAMALLVGDDAGTPFAVGVVCDGVSTTMRPDDASQGAVDAAAAVLLAAGPARRDHLGAYDAARAAVAAVDFEPGGALGPPSCTYLAAIVTDHLISLASLGDCRAYWHDAVSGVIRQLTVDDSWATHQVAGGAMAPAEAYADPRAHSITAWLGVDADPGWTPALIELDRPGAGRLLLVSDGLWNYTPGPDDVAAVVAAGEPGALATARRLVDHANGSGGADNITVVVVDLPLSKGAAPA